MSLRIVAVLVIALGAFVLEAPQAYALSGGACCTSGDGEFTCCGESCWASEDSCGATCSSDPMKCLEAD